MTESLETNGFEQNDSKDNYEKLRDFFKKRIELLESQELIYVKEVCDGKTS